MAKRAKKNMFQKAHKLPTKKPSKSGAAARGKVYVRAYTRSKPGSK